MKNLWSPWRSEYIHAVTTSDATSTCFLCTAAQNQAQDDASALVVARRQHCFVIMNRFPYNAGHIMVVPYRHCPELSLLRDEELVALFHTVREAESVLQRAFQPHGINIGINIGSAAGAGVPGHLHVHLVPRWNGDVNFMPVLAEVKVISERLEETYARLHRAFAESATYLPHTSSYGA
ncbi:MAG: HIT domain-containing protein [Bacteroidota bacterium]|nr:HIT domain-containing protein [Candidatus Kapabacteria bacterium]MDW8219716.1 HIT domain-containing protein [Bacteroidota bacterium]